MITRKRIQAGEQRLREDGIPELIPEFRRLMVRGLWAQRVSCVFAVIALVATVFALTS